MNVPFTDAEETEIQNAMLAADEAVVDEIIREAEIFIGEQFKAALAADSRALTLASVLGAAATLATGNLISISGSQPHIWPYAFGVVIIILALVLALINAVSAAKPISFEYNGNSPDQWLSDIVERKSLAEARAGQAFAYAVGIRTNKISLETNQRRITRAMTIALVGVIVGIGVAAFIAVVRFSAGDFP